MQFAHALALEVKARYEDDTHDLGDRRWTPSDEAWYQGTLKRDAKRLRRYARRHGPNPISPKTGKLKIPKSMRGPRTRDTTPYDAGMTTALRSYYRHRKAPGTKPKKRTFTAARHRPPENRPEGASPLILGRVPRDMMPSLREGAGDPRFRQRGQSGPRYTPVILPQPKPIIPTGRRPKRQPRRTYRKVGSIATPLPVVIEHHTRQASNSIRDALARATPKPETVAQRDARRASQRAREAATLRASPPRRSSMLDRRRPGAKSFADFLDLEIKAVAAPLASVSSPAAMRAPARLGMRKPRMPRRPRLGGRSGMMTPTAGMKPPAPPKP